MFIRRYLLVLLGMMLAGCVPSLQPLYRPDEPRVSEPALLGMWYGDGGQSWFFEPVEDQAGEYRAAIADEEHREGKLHLRLLRLDQALFMDSVLEDSDPRLPDYCRLHLVPTHMFAQIVFADKQLELRGLNPDWLKKYLAAHPGELKAEPVLSPDGSPVLTAATADLQAFVRKHLAEEEAFSTLVTLWREKRPPKPAEAPPPQP